VGSARVGEPGEGIALGLCVTFAAIAVCAHRSLSLGSSYFNPPPARSAKLRAGARVFCLTAVPQLYPPGILGYNLPNNILIYWSLVEGIEQSFSKSI
jgi:hypothetical protein